MQQPQHLDWLEVSSLYSAFIDHASAASPASARSAAGANGSISRAASSSLMAIDNRSLFNLDVDGSFVEAGKPANRRYVEFSPLRSAPGRVGSQNQASRARHSTASCSETGSETLRGYRRQTTFYKEFSRSFCTLEVSQKMDASAVIETSHVVVKKSDRSKTVNNYLVLGLLGKGSFGKVKLVECILTGNKYAMKIIRVPGAQARADTKRRVAVQREIAVMKQIAHPSLVRLREVLGNSESGKLYLILQYVNRGSIARKVTNTTIEPISEDRLRRQARELVSALKYLEVNGVVHRDIKPENILVDDRGHVFLSDFGVSAVCTDEGVSGVEGTPAFMAPEICRGDAEVTGHLVDIWALGVSLFQLMYGVLPFVASNRMDLTRAIISDVLVFPDENQTRWLPYTDEFGLHDVQASAEFKEVIRGMLEKEPRRRWGVRKILNSEWLSSLPAWSPHDEPLHAPEGSMLTLDISVSAVASAIVPVEITYI